MSWDVMIFNLSGKTPPPMPELQESDCKPLGPAAEVRQRISSVISKVDWSDPSWGIYEGGGFSIEFNAGNQDPVQNIMLHVRGGGDAIATIMAFTKPCGWSALDCSTGEFLDPAAPSQGGWKGFQAYRDQILKQRNEPGQG
jgi:hypothetical protein